MSASSSVAGSVTGAAEHRLYRVSFPELSRSAVRMLADTQKLHVAIAEEFGTGPGISADGRSRLLWRVAPGPAPVILVSSTTRHHAGGLCGAVIEERAYTLPDRVRAGEEYGFALTANPVRAVGGGGRSRGRLEPIDGASEQLSWLSDKGSGHGFEVLGATVVAADTVAVRRGGRQGTSSLSRVAYVGKLRVIDQAEVGAALLLGIGRGKAFGCGMLTLR